MNVHVAQREIACAMRRAVINEKNHLAVIGTKAGVDADKPASEYLPRHPTVAVCTIIDVWKAAHVSASETTGTSGFADDQRLESVRASRIDTEQKRDSCLVRAPATDWTRCKRAVGRHAVEQGGLVGIVNICRVILREDALKLSTRGRESIQRCTGCLAMGHS